ncbi:phage tail tape measure protein, partial [Streptomyces tricolor]
MALTVGELNAILSVDDRAVDPALRRAEDAMRQTGQRMGDDADRAGRQAGEQLGDGIVRSADGRLRDARGRFVAAGRRIGDDVGDGATDGAEEGGDEAASALEGGLEQVKGLIIGGVIGAALMQGLTQAIEQGQITGRLAAQLGKTPTEAQRYGKLAGELYADAVTADFQTAADAISAVMRAGIAPQDATNAQLKSIATNVADLATTFELDLGQTANAVGQMIKTGLAKDGREAVDALTAGLQQMGPRADDIVDTFNEYSTIFRQLGIDGTTATGLLSQGLKAGARDTDVVADSLKELVLITQGGGKTVDEAFKKIGLNGADMQKAFSEGGPKARAALDKVFDGLRGVGSESDRQAIALALFGTKSEDVQRALFSLDPSKATDTLGQVGGAADRMGDSLRDNAGAKVEQFKRGMQQGVVDFLGTTVIPGLMGFYSFLQGHEGEVKAAAVVIGAVLLPVIVTLGVQALIAGGRMAAAWVMALGPIGWIGLAIGALVVLVLGYWDEVRGGTLAAWDWVVGKVSSAKDSVLNTISGLGQIPGQVSGYFGQAKDWAVAKLAALLAWLAGLPGRTGSALAALGPVLVGRASSAFGSMRAAAVAKALALVAYMVGLPGRISKAIGNLGGLLVSKGAAVVQGLWNGIKSMGSWLKSQLISWAKSAIPGPIAKALGIHSPSRVTAAQGRWIARGLIEGLTGSEKQVKAASGKLADIIADGLKPGRARTRALGIVSAGTKQLLRLARDEERVAARLKDAQKKLADQVAARDKLAADVRKGILDAANITGQSGSQSPEGILARLQRGRKAAELFAKNLAALKKKGVRSDLLQQIAQAGVEQGSAVAASLASATPAQIKAINNEQAKLAKAAG